MRFRIILASVLAFVPAVVHAAKPPYTLNGKVVAITEGDILTLQDAAKGEHKIRLSGIDAPERKQTYGTQAKENLAKKVLGQAVRVDVIDIDRSKREVGRLYLGTRFVNLELVQDGSAWRFPQYDKPGEFTAAERDAREHHRGLWSEPSPWPPWEFRRLKRNQLTPAVNVR